MPVNSHRKGGYYERQVELWLEAQFGDRVTRLNGTGHKGEDFDLDRLVCIEAKNQARMDLSGWLAQADADAGPDRIPIVIHKKKGVADVGGHYVTLYARDLAALMLLARQP